MPEPVGPVTRTRPFLRIGKFLQDRRQTQILDRQNVGRNQTKDRRDAVFLLEEIRAIARHPRHFVTEIDIGGFFEDLDLSFRRDLINHRFEFVVLQRWIIDADQLAVDAQHRRIVGGEVKVGSLLLSDISLKNESMRAMGDGPA